MPFKIQRVPRGLNELLSIFGGATPTELEDRIRAHVDILQMYAQQQARVLFTNDAALAETGTVVAGASSATQWAVLFGASMGGIKTATMTAFRCSVEMVRGGTLATSSSITLAQDDLGPFGATETGAVGVAFWAPYPILMRPPWAVFGRLNILGTDATANCTCIAEIGFLS